MATTTSSSSPTSTASTSPTATPKAPAVDTKALAALLAESQSSTIYIDIEGLDDAGAAAMLSGDPPLHVEKDLVRDKWAVRKATPEEVEAAKAAAEAAAAAPAPAA
jgi:hypothetical protein